MNLKALLIILIILAVIVQLSIAYPAVGIVLLVLVGFATIYIMNLNREAKAEKGIEESKLAAMTKTEKAKYLKEKIQKEQERNFKYEEDLKISNYGNINVALVCPHCQTKGFVRTTQAVRVTKNRVNSIVGKAIGLGTNSERKVTQLHCEKCSMTWDA